MRELGPRLGCWRGSGSGHGKEKRWVGLDGWVKGLGWVRGLGWCFGFLGFLFYFLFLSISNQTQLIEFKLI